jgi:hypothetical protein
MEILYRCSIGRGTFLVFLYSLRIRKQVIPPFGARKRNEWNIILVEIAVIGERDFSEF